MPAVYPVSVKTFTPKTDNVDVIWAAHVNDLQNEMSAVERTVGTNPHVWAGWVPSGNTAWPPKTGTFTAKTPAPISNFGASKTYTSVADRLANMQKQMTWLTLMSQLLAGQSGQKPTPPPAAVIRAPGMKLPTGEGAWPAFKWGAADYDPSHMYQGGTHIYPPKSGYWDISVNVWADSTYGYDADDLHYVHARLMRGTEEVAGQDSMVAVRTWIRHRINIGWHGRWYTGTPIQVQVSQHGAVSSNVTANCNISFVFVRDL